MKAYLLYTIFVSFLFSSCNSRCQDLIIFSISPYSKENKFTNIIEKYKYYLVENFNYNCQDQYKQIKKYAIDQLDSNFSNYDGYQIVFYTETAKTNKSFKENETDLIEWHGDDIIYTFTWSKGMFVGEFEYNNGKIINKKDVKEYPIKTK